MSGPPPDRPPPRDLPVVGGHLALDFANTVDDPLGPARHDHIASYPDLVRWAVARDAVSGSRAAALLRAPTDDARDAVARAHELRASLVELFGGIADGSSDGAEHWPGLRPFVAAAAAHASLERTADGAGRWTWPQTGDPDVLLHPVASAAADLLVSTDLVRLKRCAACPWLFLDGSRNRSRRWCDMNDCGTARKIERYVARRAARRRAAGSLDR